MTVKLPLIFLLFVSIVNSSPVQEEIFGTRYGKRDREKGVVRVVRTPHEEIDDSFLVSRYGRGIVNIRVKPTQFMGGIRYGKRKKILEYKQIKAHMLKLGKLSRFCRNAATLHEKAKCSRIYLRNKLKTADYLHKRIET